MKTKRFSKNLSFNKSRIEVYLQNKKKEKGYKSNYLFKKIVFYYHGIGYFLFYRILTKKYDIVIHGEDSLLNSILAFEASKYDISVLIVKQPSKTQKETSKKINNAIFNVESEKLYLTLSKLYLKEDHNINRNSFIISLFNAIKRGVAKIDFSFDSKISFHIIKNKIYFMPFGYIDKENNFTNIDQEILKMTKPFSFWTIIKDYKHRGVRRFLFESDYFIETSFSKGVYFLTPDQISLSLGTTNLNFENNTIYNTSNRFTDIFNSVNLFREFLKEKYGIKNDL